MFFKYVDINSRHSADVLIQSDIHTYMHADFFFFTSAEQLWVTVAILALLSFELATFRLILQHFNH